MAVKTCSRCKKQFDCCNEKAGCWCETFSLDKDTLHLLKDTFADCLCQDCLKLYATQQTSEKQ